MHSAKKLSHNKQLTQGTQVAKMFPLLPTTGEFLTSPISWVNGILARRVREVSAAVVPD